MFFNLTIFIIKKWKVMNFMQLLILVVRGCMLHPHFNTSIDLGFLNLHIHPKKINCGNKFI